MIKNFNHNKPREIIQQLNKSKPFNFSNSMTRNKNSLSRTQSQVFNFSYSLNNSKLCKTRTSTLEDTYNFNKTLRDIGGNRQKRKNSIFNFKKKSICERINGELWNSKPRINHNPYWNYISNKRLQCSREQIYNSLNVSRNRSVEKGNLMKHLENSKQNLYNKTMKLYYKDKLRSSILGSNKRKNAESVIKLLEM